MQPRWEIVDLGPEVHEQYRFVVAMDGDTSEGVVGLVSARWDINTAIGMTESQARRVRTVLNTQLKEAYAH